MANDTVTRVTQRGYGQRLGGSIKGILVGLFLIAASVFLLWWNEGNLAREKAAFTEMSKAVVSASVNEVNAGNQGKLVHLSGDLSSTEEIGDPGYLNPGKYLVLSRSVEMYQWTESKSSETKKKLGGGEETITTYKYALGWASGRVDSSKFEERNGHENPSLSLEETSFRVSEAKFGAYDGADLVPKLGADEKLNLNKEILAEPNSEFGSNYLYIRKNRGSGDTLGDIRIQYTVARPGNYSIMAVQTNGGRFESFNASNGKSKFLIYPGNVSASEMLDKARGESQTLAWILRAVGLVFLWVGFFLLFEPLAVLLDVIPIFGSATRFGIGLLTGLMALVIGTLAILASMIFHNVWALVAVIALGTFGIWRWFFGKAKKASPPPPPPQ